MSSAESNRRYGWGLSEVGLQPRNRATAQPRNRATAQPRNRATAQPRNRATAQPRNRLKRKRHFSVSILSRLSSHLATAKADSDATLTGLPSGKTVNIYIIAPTTPARPRRARRRKSSCHDLFKT
jgi:hypothetical protein